MNNKPIVFGGVGGSGTRLFAQIMYLLNVYMGNCINDTEDNLMFTFLFKNKDVLKLNDKEIDNLIYMFQKGMEGKSNFNEIEKNILKNLYETHTKQNYLYDKKKVYEKFLNNSVSNQYKNDSKWGWKEPNTHIILEKLIKYYPKIKYIHVMRNGLDMAFSKNQNQLKFWTDLKPTPKNSLHYWVNVHKKIFKLQQQYPQNILFIDFDDFCLNPEKNIPILLNFIEVPVNDALIIKIKSIIKVPVDSIGRYKNHSLSQFDKSDLEFIKYLGYL